MGRPPADNPRNIQINFRVDQTTAEALDAQILVEQRPGLVLSRGDVARMLMFEALEARRKRSKTRK
jgi:hypothetical protein